MKKQFFKSKAFNALVVFSVIIALYVISAVVPFYAYKAFCNSIDIGMNADQVEEMLNGRTHTYEIVQADVKNRATKEEFLEKLKDFSEKNDIYGVIYIYFVGGMKTRIRTSIVFGDEGRVVSVSYPHRSSLKDMK